MSASNAGSPSDALPVSEDVEARISRLEMHMQQSSEALRQSSEAMRHQTTLMESILRRLDTPSVALTGGDEQLAALQEVAPMTLERRPGGNADDVLRPGRGREGRSDTGWGSCCDGIRSGVGGFVRRNRDAVSRTSFLRSPPAYRGHLPLFDGQGC